MQSTVLLMGSGADELFGGYGRHRTANVTRGCEAVKREQILYVCVAFFCIDVLPATQDVSKQNLWTSLAKLVDMPLPFEHRK